MTDRELVNHILKGDKECYSEVMRRYSSAVFSVAMSLTKRSEMAMELTQQTFVRAYERLVFFRSGNLKSWLVSIAFRLSLDTLEQEKRRRGAPVEDAVGLSAEEYSEEREQKLRRMEQAIAALPADDREIIRMHYFQRMPTKEIAERRNMSQSNVLVRLSRIRERLRKQMEI